jgi:hypothetical protein
MKKPIPVLSLVLFSLSFLFVGPGFAGEESTQPAASPSKKSVHRYLIERTFPPGALKGLDAATKKKVNANNASLGVRWVESYANADETKSSDPASMAASALGGDSGIDHGEAFTSSRSGQTAVEADHLERRGVVIRRNQSG